MNKPNPQKILIEVTLLEADVIRSLREHESGEFEIQKANGEPTQFFWLRSRTFLSRDRGKELEIKNDKG